MATQTFASSNTDRLLTLPEAAQMLGYSVKGLRHRLALGELPVVRLSRRALRVRQSALVEFVASREVPARTVRR